MNAQWGVLGAGWWEGYGDELRLRGLGGWWCRFGRRGLVGGVSRIPLLLWGERGLK